jgi:hypothetical protein
VNCSTTTAGHPWRWCRHRWNAMASQAADKGYAAALGRAPSRSRSSQMGRSLRGRARHSPEGAKPSAGMLRCFRPDELRKKAIAAALETFRLLLHSIECTRRTSAMLRHRPKKRDRRLPAEHQLPYRPGWRLDRARLSPSTSRANPKRPSGRAARACGHVHDRNARHESERTGAAFASTPNRVAAVPGRDGGHPRSGLMPSADRPPRCGDPSPGGGGVENATRRTPGGFQIRARPRG